MKRKILIWLIIGLASFSAIRILLQPASYESLNARLWESEMNGRMKEFLFYIWVDTHENGINLHELDKVVGNGLNWRVRLWMHESQYKEFDFDIDKPWSDEQNSFFRNNNYLMRRYVTRGSTPGDQFAFALILPDNSQNPRFLLLESSLNGYHWAEPQGMVKMTMNELLKQNRNDRKRVKDGKTFYCTFEHDTEYYICGTISNDKDFTKVLEKMDCNEFVVMK